MEIRKTEQDMRDLADAIARNRDPLPYRLADLVAQCDQSAPEPEDMEVWAEVKPVGREV